MLADLGPDHVAGCLEVIRSLPEWFGYEGALAGVEAALRSQEGLVDLDGTEVTGFCTFAPTFPETIEVTYLAVHAVHRRRGIGRELVAAVRAVARERGATSLCLLTLGPSGGRARQEETLAFYRATGFRPMKELPLASWGGAPALLFALPLDGNASPGPES